MPEIEYKILKNEKEIIEYEKCLYNAYMENKENWITRNYSVLENNRLKPDGIEYRDLVNYIAKHNDKIIAGITMHINPENKFILQRMGFKIDKTKDCCEGLTTFVIKEYEKDKINILMKLSDFLQDDIIRRGFKYSYGTTPEKYKNLHSMLFYAEILEIKKVGNEKRALIKRIIKG